MHSLFQVVDKSILFVYLQRVALLTDVRAINLSYVLKSKSHPIKFKRKSLFFQCADNFAVCEHFFVFFVQGKHIFEVHSHVWEEWGLQSAALDFIPRRSSRYLPLILNILIILQLVFLLEVPRHLAFLACVFYFLGDFDVLDPFELQLGVFFCLEIA